MDLCGQVVQHTRHHQHSAFLDDQRLKHLSANHAQWVRQVEQQLPIWSVVLHSLVRLDRPVPLQLRLVAG